MSLTSFLEDGYKSIAPSEEAERIDMEIVKRMKCSKCGGNMRYEPYYNEKTGSYIAIAVCIKCGRKVTF